MGSFSFLKADNLTKVANIVYGAPFKFLIPQEFGGGFIEDHYQDYGRLGTKEDGTPKYDMYELLAFWNHELVTDDLKYSETALEAFWEYQRAIGNIHDAMGVLEYTGDLPMMKEIDDYTDNNRVIGIDIGCYRKDIARLKYPLKLVSVSYTGTYEDLKTYSVGDPNQGFSPLYRKYAD